ncbi:thiopurine S-methyltransferase [Roseixanthobacter liquoris]|uniref:thiopurine S-methyltransferase n=1 Tax=Roseixanthobacter liquoris TaxID=3119921 RepID=UPI003728420F
MDLDFWRSKWENNQIAFHEGTPNALLVKHLAQLDLNPGARIFVPLCGKTKDIFWLLSQGFEVVGAEVSPLAVEHLFADLDLSPEMSDLGPLRKCSAPGIDIFIGDIFEVTRERLGPVDAVYDRAALVALPEPLRARYAAHLVEISAAAPQLLICFDYDQSLIAGPPFAVSPAHARMLYGATHDLRALDSVEVPGGLKGACEAWERVLLLRRRSGEAAPTGASTPS